MEMLAIDAPRRRVLLDSNIWRYVVDASAQGRLLHAARSGCYRVQIAPAVVYEALRLHDIPLRNRLVTLMTNRGFERLMPEAYSEAMEILEEIRRLRPEWLRRQPDLSFFERLRKDWAKKTGGFWVRCSKSTYEEAYRISSLEGDLIQRGAEQFRKARREMLESGWNKLPSLNERVATPARPVAGWNGDRVEPWRLHSWVGLTAALSNPGNPYRDWIAPWIDVDSGLLSSPGWVAFWLHQTNSAAMPRQWLRTAHDFAQRFRKVTDGSGGDNQLFTYLIETDVVVSADKAFLAILDEIRQFAPCPLPEGVLAPAGREGADFLFGLLDKRRTTAAFR